MRRYVYIIKKRTEGKERTNIFSIYKKRNEQIEKKNGSPSSVLWVGGREKRNWCKFMLGLLSSISCMVANA